MYARYIYIHIHMLYLPGYMHYVSRRYYIIVKQVCLCVRHTYAMQSSITQFYERKFVAEI